MSVDNPGVTSAIMNTTATNFLPADVYSLENNSLTLPGSVAFAGAKSPLAHAVVFWKTSAGLSFDDHNQTTFTALEFMLQWCVQTYNTTVVGGSPSTVLSSTQHPYSNFSWVVKNVDGFSRANLTAVPIGIDGREFVISQGEHWGLHRVFQNLFTASLVIADFGDNIEASAGTTSVADDHPVPKIIQEALRPLRDDLSESVALATGRLNKLLQNLAITMTN